MVVKVPKHRNGASEWAELDTHLHVPPHPNIIPFVGVCRDWHHGREAGRKPGHKQTIFCLVTLRMNGCLKDFVTTEINRKVEGLGRTGGRAVRSGVAEPEEPDEGWDLYFDMGPEESAASAGKQAGVAKTEQAGAEEEEEKERDRDSCKDFMLRWQLPIHQLSVIRDVAEGLLHLHQHNVRS